MSTPPMFRTQEEFESFIRQRLLELSRLFPQANTTIVIRHRLDNDGVVLTTEMSPMDIENLIQTIRRFNGH